jgi:hypothetical protein
LKGPRSSGWCCVPFGEQRRRGEAGADLSARRRQEGRNGGPRNEQVRIFVFPGVLTFLLWCLLLIISWPLALIALVAYPVVWVALIPFRLVGIAVGGILALIRSVVMLPARMLGRPRSA